MSRKFPFTEEQMRILEQNPYTHTVFPNRIVFTLEFKQFFIDQVNTHHKTTKSIMKEAGYDLSLFSDSNLDYIRKTVINEAKSDTGLKAPKGLTAEQRTAAFEAKNLAVQRTDISIKELQERIVYLEKQVEFLKKISNIRKPSTLL